MANPSGTNQFAGFGSEAPYGDVRRQTELSRSAPMSGAPIATRATEAPRRSKRRAAQPNAPAAAAPAGPPAPGGGLSPTPEAQVATIWQALAAEEGASPLIQQYAAQAQV